MWMADLNDELNLDLYSKLLLFKNDISREETLWHYPENTLQRILQSLAHRLDLEYEFSLTTRTVRISRPSMPIDTKSHDSELLSFGDPENDRSLFDLGFSQSNDTGMDYSWCCDVSTVLPQPEPPFDVLFEAAQDSENSFPNLSNRHDRSSGFCTDIPVTNSPGRSQTRHLNFTTANFDLQCPRSLPLQQDQVAVSPSMEVDQSSSQPLMSPAALPNPPYKSNLQLAGSVLKYLDSTIKSAASDSVQAEFDVDMDDSNDSIEVQKIDCADYPPCNLSFNWSEELTRHVK